MTDDNANVVKFPTPTPAITVVGGLSVLGAGLFSMGISRKSVLQYETAIRANKFLVIGNGTEEEVVKAHDIIETTNVTDCALHAAAWQDQCAL